MVKRRDIDRVMWGSERRAKANLWVKHRNRTMVASKPGHTLCLGNSRAGTYLLALWCPVQSRRESDPGFRTELENLVGSVKGKGTSGRAVRPKVPMGQPGADCSVIPRRRRNFRGGKISELVCQEFLCDCFHRQEATIYNICTVLAC